MGSAIALVLSLAFASSASAQKLNSDDLKWINQCINDNKSKAGAIPAIVRSYCTCMNEKMDSNETRPISEWEKANTNERDACNKRSARVKPALRALDR